MATQLIGESPPIKNLEAMINRVAATKTNILIIGESGTGKELVARLIHETGPLKGRPFVPVNCGAIPETLIESEMFGHKKGSFTGAVADKNGLFQAADGGTLFLDEVGELPLTMQVKLLRAIQERVVRKVGGTEDAHVEVRIIAATNRDLEKAIGKGIFREDLFYRLNVIMIRTPPLRERPEDIPILVSHFLTKLGARFKKEVMTVEPQAMDVLKQHRWPGNVRELENVLERAVALASGSIVSIQSLPQSLLGNLRVVEKPQQTGIQQPPQTAPGSEIRIPAPDFSKGPMNLDEILGNIERTYLLSALEYTAGVKKKAAEVLGITFRSIRYRLKKLGVENGDDGEDE